MVSPLFHKWLNRGNRDVHGMKKIPLFVMILLLLGAMGAIEACDAPLVNVDSLSGSTRVYYMNDILRKSRTGLSAPDEAKLVTVIIDESHAYRVDPLLVMAMIKTESTYYNWARSYKGAMGLMQIMPPTGRWVAGEIDLEWDGDDILYDPYTNVRLGIHYFSALKQRYEDNLELTLAAYNAGPTRLSSLMRRGRALPRVYAGKVLDNYRELKQMEGYL